MSELINARNDGRNYRWQLLTTVSALALLAATYGSREAEAANQVADRPTVWIELGGQLEHMNDSQEVFSPPFMASITQANLLSALDVQQPPAYAIGTEGKIEFQPNDSNWVFSASVRYGRSDSVKNGHQQTPNAKVPVHITYAGITLVSRFVYPRDHVKFSDGRATQSERHLILDFQAGKDVGLGMFGNQGSSVVNAGVRIAQFTSKSNVKLHADPDLQYPTAPISGNYFTVAPAAIAFYNAHIRFHDFAAMMTNQRSFHGIGPSIAWNASAPLAGNPDRGEVVLDWGLNAAVLFGRQKVRGHHQTGVKSYYYDFFHATSNFGHTKGGHFINQALGSGQVANYTGVPTAHHTNAANVNRMRTVVVPNLGAFAGLSFVYSNAKVSFGYRADFFLGAMDGGIDTQKSEDVGFHGPFAMISIGLGG